jgi:hypothetical protein
VHRGQPVRQRFLRIRRLYQSHPADAEVRAAGFDPFINANVELLNYSDILRRFPLAGFWRLLRPAHWKILPPSRSRT